MIIFSTLKPIIKFPIWISIVVLLLAACQEDHSESLQEKRQENVRQESNETSAQVNSASNTETDKSTPVAMNTVTGSFTYRERLALPASAVAQIKLSDVSIMDIPAPVLAEQRIELTNRNVPIEYQLSVPADALHVGLQYAVHAEIRATDNNLLWTTDQLHLINPSLATQTLAPIILKQVNTAPRNQGSLATTAQTGLIGAWRVEQIDGMPVIDRSHTELNFSADLTLAGSTGCNRFSASYSTRNGLLTLSPVAMTRRACIPALNEQEQRYVEILNRIDRYQFDAQGRLIVSTPDGKQLLATRMVNEPLSLALPK